MIGIASNREVNILLIIIGQIILSSYVGQVFAGGDHMHEKHHDKHEKYECGKMDGNKERYLAMKSNDKFEKTCDDSTFIKERKENNNTKYTINSPFFPQMEKETTEKCQMIAYDKMLTAAMRISCEHNEIVKKFLGSEEAMNCFADVDTNSTVDMYNSTSTLEDFTHYKNDMVMECVDMVMNFTKSEVLNKTQEDYIIEYIDCKMGQKIEQCVRGKLTCSNSEAEHLAYDLIWAITDSICFEGMLWFWINVGIGIAGGIIFLVFVICIVVICCKKKKDNNKVQQTGNLDSTMRRPRDLNRTLTGAGILANIEPDKE